MLRFSFICILLYGLSNGTANAFLHIPQLVGQQFQVLTYLLGGSLRVDLSGLYVGMPHSAATTILLSNGVPIETVSRLLGHTNIKTTQIYAKITAQKISQDLELLSDKLGDMEKSICSAI
jgi:hypothetical protein